MPVLAALGVSVLVVVSVRTDGRVQAWRRLSRPLLLTLVVLAVGWSQPVVDQVAGEGNLATVVTHGAGGDTVAGPRFAAQVLASVGAVPGGWGPGGFEGLRVDLEADRPAGEAPKVDDLADSGTAAPWAIAAGALLAAVAWFAWRARDRVWGSAIVVAVVALASAFVSVALLPVSDVLGVAAHQLRPVWPVVLFATAVVATTLVRRLPRTELVMPVLAGSLLVLRPARPQLPHRTVRQCLGHPHRARPRRPDGRARRLWAGARRPLGDPLCGALQHARDAGTPTKGRGVRGGRRHGRPARTQP